MRIKTSITLSLIMLAIILLSGFAHAAPVISISDFSIEEGSLNANLHNFNLDLELKNNGNTCAKVTVTAQANPPFLTDQTPTTDPIEVCSHRETVTLPFRLTPNVIGGSYPLPLIINYIDENTSVSYSTSNTITLFINGNSDLNAHIINSNPLNIYPGDTATISVLVENDGTLQADSINGILSTNPPLEIKSAQSFLSIGSLQPKQSASEDFSIEIPKNALAQTYPMTLSLQYIENKVMKKKDIPLSLDIKKVASFETSDAGSDTLHPSDSSKIVRIKITNTGTNFAKEIKVQLQPQFPFSTDGSIRYITSLDQGESKVVQFVVDIDKAATIGSYGLDLILDFKDEQGNILHDTATASLTIENKNIFQVIFIDYWYLWLILLIIILIIVLRIRRSRKNKSD